MSEPATREQKEPLGPIAWLLMTGVRGYQLIISPWIAPRCRFYPSCSAYTVTALRRHGALKGTWLAVRRLGRCNPWNPGGVDHVPPRATDSHQHEPGGPGGSARTSDSPFTATAVNGHDADGHPTAA